MRESATWTWIAVAVWSVLLAAVCIRGIVQPTSHSLVPTYARAGSEWLTRGVVYHDRWTAPFDQYRYSPLVTALLVPLSRMPPWLAGVLWRLLNAGVFLGAFAWWLDAAVPPLSSRYKAILFLLIAPLALGSLNNGQPNPLMIGLLLAAIAATASERWTLAAFCIALSCALKVYPLAVGLLLAVVFPRRFAPRLLFALIILALLPFLLQQPDYVADQYVQWFQRLRGDDRKYWPLEAAYRDLWLLFRRVYVPITPRLYLGLQLVSAAGCALLCATARLRGLPREDWLLLVLALGSCWMMLCGPATESCTYVVLAPTAAWAILRVRPRLLPRLAFALLLAGVAAGLFPRTGRIHGLGMQPLAALLLFVSYLPMGFRSPVRIKKDQTVRAAAA
jgi:hypothetical protein